MHGIQYDSPRKLRSVVNGLVRGIAEHYGEAVQINETRCMLRGDGSCAIVVNVGPQDERL